MAIQKNSKKYKELMKHFLIKIKEKPMISMVPKALKMAAVAGKAWTIFSLCSWVAEAVVKNKKYE